MAVVDEVVAQVGGRLGGYKRGGNAMNNHVRRRRRGSTSSAEIVTTTLAGQDDGCGNDWSFHRVLLLQGRWKAREMHLPET
ncbi:hypothetical protein GCM10010353_63060 [Streptomyces chryseus]|nr:hypothetical protein GCM10010353_63060 [Streptomyces chryseus]